MANPFIDETYGLGGEQMFFDENALALPSTVNIKIEPQPKATTSGGATSSTGGGTGLAGGVTALSSLNAASKLLTDKSLLTHAKTAMADNGIQIANPFTGASETVSGWFGGGGAAAASEGGATAAMTGPELFAGFPSAGGGGGVGGASFGAGAATEPAMGVGQAAGGANPGMAAWAGPAAVALFAAASYKAIKDKTKARKKRKPIEEQLAMDEIRGLSNKYSGQDFADFLSGITPQHGAVWFPMLQAAIDAGPGNPIPSTGAIYGNAGQVGMLAPDQGYNPFTADEHAKAVAFMEAAKQAGVLAANEKAERMRQAANASAVGDETDLARHDFVNQANNYAHLLANPDAPERIFIGREQAMADLAAANPFDVGGI